MNCARFRERLVPFEEGALPAAERAEFEEHVRSCAACAAERDAAAANAEFLRVRLALFAPAARPDLSFLEERAEAPAPAAPPAAGAPAAERPPRRIPVVVPAAVLLLLGAAAVWFATRSDDAGDGGTEAGGPAAVETTRTRSPPEPAAPPAGAPTGLDGKPLVDPGARTPETPADPRAGRPLVARQALPQLLAQYLGGPTNATLSQVWAALDEKPGEGRRILDALSRNPETEERILLTLSLAPAADRPEAKEALLSLLEGDGEPRVRLAAAAALVRTGDAPATPVTVHAGLAVPAGPVEDAGLRTRLVAALTAERDPKALGVLLRLLGPSQSEDPGVTRRLVEIVRGDDAQLREAALEALRSGRPLDTAPVREIVLDPAFPSDLRAGLVPAAVGADPAKMLPAVREILQRTGEEDREVKAAALRALASAPSEEGAALALAVYRAEAAEPVRRAAIAALAAGPAGPAAAALKSIVASEGNPSLKSAAQGALEKLGAAAEDR